MLGNNMVKRSKKLAFLAILQLLLCDPAQAGKQSIDAPNYSLPTGGRCGLGTFSSAETIRVTATIAPLFKLSVEVVGGGMALDFGSVRQGESPPRKELVVGMRCNLRRPYQITQEAFGPLQNDQGDTIPYDRFTCVTYGVTGNKTKGQLGAKQPTPVTEKPFLLFVSDEDGRGDFFTVGYNVTPPPEQRYGEYKTVLIFTATLI